MNAVELALPQPHAPDDPALVDAWTSAHGDRIVVHLAKGAVSCGPLVGQLLDAVAPTTRDPAGGFRPSRRYLLDADGRDHIVLVASKLEAGHDPVPVALARCVRVAASRVGLPSVVVRDDMRGRGIGTRLLTVLRAVAESRGIERFRVDVSGEDIATLHMLRRVGLHPMAVMHGLRPTIDISLASAT